MKPTQEQILSALNKLIKENKTELKAEKIELGTIDDYKKLRKSAGTSYEKYVDTMDTSKGYLSTAIKDAEKAVKILSKAAPMLTNIQKQAKELGVDLPKELKEDTTQSLLEISKKDLSMMKSIFGKMKVR